MTPLWQRTVSNRPKEPFKPLSGLQLSRFPFEIGLVDDSLLKLQEEIWPRSTVLVTTTFPLKRAVADVAPQNRNSTLQPVRRAGTREQKQKEMKPGHNSRHRSHPLRASLPEGPRQNMKEKWMMLGQCWDINREDIGEERNPQGSLHWVTNWHHKNFSRHSRSIAKTDVIPIPEIDANGHLEKHCAVWRNDSS